MKLPRNFFKPLAIGAPSPLRELPVKLERMIHFVPPQIEKLRAKVPELITQVDVVLGNLEDAIPADAKEAARAGFITMAKANDLALRLMVEKNTQPPGFARRAHAWTTLAGSGTCSSTSIAVARSNSSSENDSRVASSARNSRFGRARRSHSARSFGSSRSIPRPTPTRTCRRRS